MQRTAENSDDLAVFVEEVLRAQGLGQQMADDEIDHVSQAVVHMLLRNTAIVTQGVTPGLYRSTGIHYNRGDIGYSEASYVLTRIHEGVK